MLMKKVGMNRFRKKLTQFEKPFYSLNYTKCVYVSKEFRKLTCDEVKVTE